MKLKDDLEDKRHKMMRKIKMTNAELDTMRLSRSTSVKDMFSSGDSSVAEVHTTSATYDL